MNDAQLKGIRQYADTITENGKYFDLTESRAKGGMKMTRDQILKELESGRYEIETNSTCDCEIDRINEDGSIDYTGNECWHARALYIGDELIAEYVQFNSLTMHTTAMTKQDIVDNYYLFARMHISDNDKNPAHDPERILSDYFEYYPDAKFYRDNERGFSNEYTILVDLNGNVDDDINDDWDVIDADEAAREIAYNGDAATQAYNKLRLLRR